MPATGDGGGTDFPILALAIVVAGLAIAIGLAVGLRGRRPGSDSASGEAPGGTG